MPARKRRPAKPDRATMLAQGLDVIALLRERPVRTEELAATLGVSRSTAEAILSSIRAAALGLTTEARGKERWHSLPADTLRKVL